MHFLKESTHEYLKPKLINGLIFCPTCDALLVHKPGEMVPTKCPICAQYLSDIVGYTASVQDLMRIKNKT